MKKKYRIGVLFAVVLTLFFIGSVFIVNAQQRTTESQFQVTKKDHNREQVVGKIQTSSVRLSKKLTKSQLDQLQTRISRPSQNVINNIITGVIPPQPTSCFGIPLTDYYVCVDIWIEDTSPGPG
ncbi:hypothetical protein ACKFKG_25860 [Phormidesmis sp. 146-35]